MVPVIFKIELVNSENEKKKKKRKDVFMLFKNEHLCTRYIAVRKCVLANGLDMGFVSFTGNLLVA